MLLAILIAMLIFLIDAKLVTKFKHKYYRYKEAKKREKSRLAFRKKMKELEIK